MNEDLRELTKNREFSDKGAAAYLERLAQIIEAGEPIPDEMRGPLVEGIINAVSFLKLNPDPLPHARKSLCFALGLYEDRRPKKRTPSIEDKVIHDSLMGNAACESWGIEPNPTVKQLADRYEVSERTIQRERNRWRKILTEIDALEKELPSIDDTDKW